MAEAFLQALRMSPAEQRDRMQLMRDLVCERNVYRWAAQMLLDAARLRQRQRIASANPAGDYRRPPPYPCGRLTSERQLRL